MKTCTICNTPKETSEFNRNKAKRDGLQAYCRLCQAGYEKTYYSKNSSRRRQVRQKTKIRRQEIREWLWNLKLGLACVKCGENDPACLDFHHKDSRQKEFELSEAVRRGWSKNRLLKEISKCDCLCSNCHRKFHCYGEVMPRSTSGEVACLSSKPGRVRIPHGVLLVD